MCRTVGVMRRGGFGQVLQIRTGKNRIEYSLCSLEQYIIVLPILMSEFQCKYYIVRIPTSKAGGGGRFPRSRQIVREKKTRNFILRNLSKEIVKKVICLIILAHFGMEF